MEGSYMQQEAPTLAFSGKTPSDVLPIFTSQPLADDAPLLTDIQPDVSIKAKKATGKTKVRRLLVLGILQLICGLLLLPVNIVGLCFGMQAAPGVLGIAGGLLATLTGCFGIRLSRKSTNKWAGIFVVFSLVSVIVAGCVIGFTASAADEDGYHRYRFVRLPSPESGDGYYEYVYDNDSGWGEFYGHSVLDGRSTCRFVLDIVSCCLALGEIIIAFVTVLMTCRTFCCSTPANQASASNAHQNPAPSAATQFNFQFGSVGANCSMSCFCPSCGTDPGLSEE